METELLTGTERAPVNVDLHELDWFYYALYSIDLNKYVHFLSIEDEWKL